MTYIRNFSAKSHKTLTNLLITWLIRLIFLIYQKKRRHEWTQKSSLYHADKSFAAARLPGFGSIFTGRRQTVLGEIMFGDVTLNLF